MPHAGLFKRLAGACAFAATLGAAFQPAIAQREAFWDQAEALSKIGHIVVIYEENRSMDSYFGAFPGVNGRANAGAAATQTDGNGQAFTQLPPILNSNIGYAVDTRFPVNLPNQPFQADKYVAKSDLTGDMFHKYYIEQMQINGGKMDRFAYQSDAKGLSMAYWDITDQPEYKYASQFTLSDNTYHSAFGGSYMNHIMMVCACVLQYPNAPAALRTVVDPATGFPLGNPPAEKNLTPDNYVVNTTQSVQLHSPSNTDPSLLVPAQTGQNIGDLLDAKKVTWKWYSGGFNDVVAGHPGPLFQYHHQAMMYYAENALGSAHQLAHVQDYTDLMKDIANNTLPQVVFYKPYGQFNLHPGYANITDGESHLDSLIKALQASPAYADMMIIITFDEHGGQWDHVAPPKRDKWGPGSRVPLIVISPFAKRGYVDHTQYETLSIIKTIEDRFGTGSLNTLDAQATNLRNTLQ